MIEKIKIHEGCGGICRMVESMDAGVGMEGECMKCGKTGLYLEEMIPIEPNHISIEKIKKVSISKRKKLNWKPKESYEDNQKRLIKILSEEQ